MRAMFMILHSCWYDSWSISGIRRKASTVKLSCAARLAELSSGATWTTSAVMLSLPPRLLAMSMKRPGISSMLDSASELAISASSR